MLPPGTEGLQESVSERYRATRSSWPECQDLPLTLRADEFRKIESPKLDQEFFGYEIQIDRVVLPDKIGPTVLRLLHGNAYFTEIVVDKPGSYFARGPIKTSKDSQLSISLVDVWPQPRESEISISKVRPLLEQLVQTQTSDWMNYSETSFKQSQNAYHILKSLDPLGIVIETSTHFQRYVRKSAIETFTFLQGTGLFEQLIRSRLLPPFQTSETSTTSFPLCLHVPRGWKATPDLTPSLLISLIETWLDIDEHLLSVGGSPYCLIDCNLENFATFGHNQWQLVDFGSIQPCPNSFFTGIETLVRNFLPLLKLRELYPDHGISLLRHLWLTGHDFELGILQKSGTKEIQQWLGIQNTAMTSAQDRKDLANRIRIWLKALSLEARSDFWSTYGVPISSEIKRFESKLPVIEAELCRDDVIASILYSIPGTTLLDLGCASGKFSALAAQLGFDVLAIDANEHHVDTISTECQSHSSLSISARTMEISSRSLNELSLYKADVVLCLALAHHLLLANFSVIKRKPISFGELTESLADLTTNFLLVEFMPLGLASSANNFNPLPDPLPEEYSLSNFTEHLSACFTDVSVIKYSDPSHHHRVLLLCEK